VKPSKVRVWVEDHLRRTKTRVELPNEVPMKQLIPALILRLGLPTYQDGQPVTYRLDNRQTGQRIGDEQILAEAGVQEETVLALFRDVGTPDGAVPPPPAIEDWQYLDFELQIIPVRDGYLAEVLASPAGEASEPFQPPAPLAVENFALKASRPRRDVRRVDSPAWVAAQEFGRDLFQRVFHGRVLACLIASIQAAQKQECGLRLKLRLNKAPELMQVPWEFLYQPDRRIFLAPQEDLPIVRFLHVQESPRSLHTELPLRILAMAASPTDLHPLNVKQERDNLAQALEPLTTTGQVAADWVKGGSLGDLYNYLTGTAVRHHVFHFIGHGGFDSASGQGFLAMEGPGRRVEIVTGDRLAPLLLAGKRRFRLAVLNACEGARSGGTDPFAGLATSLVLACGLPAVVAMQFEISDTAAIIFAASFYRALATGRPVDTAVTTARLAIWATQNDIEWGTPVLYMRSPDGRLFDFATH
jgi:hypothetical protein